MAAVTPARRLLYLVTEDWYFVSHRLLLARAAVAAGYQVAVACRVQQHADAIAAEGCEVLPLRLDRAGRNPLREAGTIVELTRLYRQYRPDLVHHVALKPVLYGSIAARLARVPHVVNALAGLGFVFTGSDGRARWLRPAITAAFRRLLARPSDRVLMQNPDDLAVLVQEGMVRQDRTVLIRGSGVDLTQFAPTPEPEGTPVVLLPARMLKDKGIEEFVAAARMLRAEGIAARFVLAGGEDPSNPTAIPRDRLDAWVGEGIVEWRGHCASMAPLYADSTIVCLPSYREGLPKALLEAAACGRPMVATDAPGCREVVIPEETGLLVCVADAEDLARALRRMLTERDFRLRCGRAARQMAEQEFGIERVTERTLALYRELLG